MKRFAFLLLIASLVIVPVSSVSLAQDEITWQCPPEFAGQTLNVYNWSLYIGETTIANFEELCDVEVVYDVYDTTEVVISRLREGNPGYDVVFMSDFMITMMVEEGYLEPLDYAKIPNYANIGDEFKDPAYDPGNAYSVPYLWGTTGLMVNTEVVTEPITSWTQFFEYDGPVAWLDEATTLIAVGSLMTGHAPNAANEAEVMDARDYLIANGGNVRTISANIIPLMETGEVDMAIGYSGEAYQLLDACQCDHFTYVIPGEGSNIYMDAMSIPVGAQNPDLAHAFIDFILDPVVGAEIATYIWYATPNQAVIDQSLVDQDYLDDPAISVDPDVVRTLFYLEYNIDLELPILDAWDEVTLSVGG